MVLRVKVLGIGMLLGAVFSFWMAGPVMSSGMGVADRSLVWSSIMGGPVLGTIWGMIDFHPSISLGWLSMLLIPAHPVRPSVATGCVTAFGLLLWFFAGFVAVMIAVG